ncbi:MAG: hypothetical protein NDJ24_03365 [Alphaproteobacteria bacterium]|nr:hypothetical protein [Alphaproteobacteria bacterium]
MNDDDFKSMMKCDIEPASELSRLRTVKESAQHFRKSSVKSTLKSRMAVLCMIAVMMFTGLSYTITQSTRSGGGSADHETGLINSAQLTQYPAGVRTAVVRMIIGGLSLETLNFATPDELISLKKQETAVFSQQGGGATYAEAPEKIMADGQAGAWVFNAEISLPMIGSAQSDLVAYLPGIREDVCKKLNEKLGVSDVIPQLRSDQSDLYSKRMLAGYVLPSGVAPLLDSADLQGQPYGCFKSYDGGTHVYYHVLMER